MNLCLFVCLSFWLNCKFLTVCQPFNCLDVICLSPFSLPVFLNIWIYMSIYLTVTTLEIWVYLTIFPSVNLSVYLSNYPFLFYLGSFMMRLLISSVSWLALAGLGQTDIKYLEIQKFLKFLLGILTFKKIILTQDLNKDDNIHK